MFNRRGVTAAPAAALTLLLGSTLPAVGSNASGETIWTEPAEQAFRFEVPSGWDVNGGISHNGVLYQQWAVLTEAKDRQVIQINDENLRPFVVPTPEMEKAGLHEGQSIQASSGVTIVLRRSLSPAEFNRWYGTDVVTKRLKDFTLGKDRDDPSLSKRLTEAARKTGGPPADIRVGATTFTGKTVSSGAPISGLLISVIARTGSPGHGDESWIARPIVVGYVESDHSAATKRALAAALTSALMTWQDDPDWQKAFNAKLPDPPADAPPAEKEADREQKRSAAQLASLMGSYWKDLNVRRESAQHFARLITESTH